MTKTFDAIVVGARVAGSPTAMLLARKGYDVLLVDRATFPSDTISTHLVHPPGIDALQRWGLLGRVLATGCPAIDTYAFDFGPFTLSGAPGARRRSGTARGGPCWTSCWWTPPAEAGAEVREGFSVEDHRLRRWHVTGVRGHAKGGATVTEHARVVIGADGRHSLVAQAVDPEQYHEKPPLLAALLRLLERPADGRPLRDLRTARPRHGGVADERRADARDRRLAVRASSRPTRRTSKATI